MASGAELALSAGKRTGSCDSALVKRSVSCSYRWPLAQIYKTQYTTSVPGKVLFFGWGRHSATFGAFQRTRGAKRDTNCPCASRPAAGRLEADGDGRIGSLRDSHSHGEEHRVFYVAKFAEGVYVLHAFEKKFQRTARADIELGQQRMRDVLAERRERAARAKREK